MKSTSLKGAGKATQAGAMEVMTMSKSKKPLTGEAFDKLSDSDKKRIYRELDGLTSRQIKEKHTYGVDPVVPVRS